MAKELIITDDKVREAAKTCSEARRVLQTLFPDVFKDNDMFDLAPLQGKTDELILTRENQDKVFGDIVIRRSYSDQHQHSFYLEAGKGIDWKFEKSEANGCYYLTPFRRK